MGRILLLFLFFTSLSAAGKTGQIELGRVEDLLNLSGSFKQDGPNCFASVAYASGFIDDAAYVDSGLFQAALETPYCQTLKTSTDLRVGDFVLLGGSPTKGGDRWEHAILYMGVGQVFAKMGFKKEEAASVVAMTENIQWYLQQIRTPQGRICAASFLDERKRAMCERHSLFPSYFRCDWKALRNELENSTFASLWAEILKIRQQLFKDTLQESPERHDAIKDRLDHLEQQVLNSSEVKALKNIVLATIHDTREQVHLMDDFIIGL